MMSYTSDKLLNIAISKGDLEQVRKLLASYPEEYHYLLKGMLKSALEDYQLFQDQLVYQDELTNEGKEFSLKTQNRLEIVKLLLTFEHPIDISDFLFDFCEKSSLKLLLDSKCEGNITLALRRAAKTDDMELMKLLLSSGRQYDYNEIISKQRCTENFLKVLTAFSKQEVVRTGKNVEGSVTHPWQTGGLAFLAARAVAAYESGGTVQLPLKFRQG